MNLSGLCSVLFHTRGGRGLRGLALGREVGCGCGVELSGWTGLLTPGEGSVCILRPPTAVPPPPFSFQDLSC